jgi:alpha-L-rhamnosidase
VVAIQEVVAAPSALTTDGLVEPIGIGSDRPSFAWRNAGIRPQTAYEVHVTAAGTQPGSEPLWSSRRVAQADPWGVVYAGPQLASSTSYDWTVRTWDDEGTASAWSEPARFESGLLAPGDWTARWVGMPRRGRRDARTAYFRATSELPAPVVRARAYVSALGWYRLFVNGVDLTGHALVPRWTPFWAYVEYQTYDVTDALRAGHNTIGTVVADGRYRGTLGVLHRRSTYGDRLGVLVQVEIDLADGSHVTVGSDGSWHAGEGRIRRADPKTGEQADLRIDDTDWLHPDGRTRGEAPVEMLTDVPPALIAEEVGRVEVVARLPATVTRTPSGVQLIDLGQNIAGVARVRLRGPAGRKVTLEYSEVLTPGGELDTSYLLQLGARGGWFQRDEVVLSGETVEHTPSFTIHGFRYVAVHGLDTELTSDDVEGLVLSTDMAYPAEFRCSDPRLEQLWRNVVWSMRSNVTDTATDCPTRERSGWTGDIQVFGATALQLADCAPFLRRYLRNLAVEQHLDGTIPPVIPAEDAPARHRNLLRIARTSVGWGDVAVMLPWELYRHRGDVEVLRRHYPSARAWVHQLALRAATRQGLRRRFGRRVGGGLGDREHYLVDTGYHWGEWLRPGGSLVGDVTRVILRPPAAIATAYLANSARLVGKMAEELGDDTDASRYAELAARVRDAWQAAFVRERGARIGDDQQDDYVRALAFDLLEHDDRPRAVGRLVELIEGADWHLGTGFLSTPMLLTVLADAGRSDVAYRLLMQDTPPSWLAQVERGATTTWETWEGYDDDGNAVESHNHYAFGSVVRFLHERVAGLEPLEPGYHRMRVAPVVGGGLTSASVTLDTPFGSASSSWHLDDGRLALTVTVPCGAMAEVHVHGAVHEVGAGTHTF